jgi:hypothetical protein
MNHEEYFEDADYCGNVIDQHKAKDKSHPHFLIQIGAELIDLAGKGK